MNPMQMRAIADRGLLKGCFMCKWIIEDLGQNGKLTDYPLDSNDKGQFPASGKLKHLELEQKYQENR